MPTVTNNLILCGLSGKLGNIVVRQRNGKIIVQVPPVRRAPTGQGVAAGIIGSMYAKAKNRA